LAERPLVREHGFVPGHRTGPVLLYDDACGLCAACVRLILRRDRRGSLRFAALRSPYAGAVLVDHPQIRGVDSVIWYEPTTRDGPERVAVRSEAVLRILGYLGGWWRLMTLIRLVPRGIRDWCYDWVARRRMRLCAPNRRHLWESPAQRERFIA
jgi:predicted DCC family thiol-disulfide oxidoreductase YuxK